MTEPERQPGHPNLVRGFAGGEIGERQKRHLRQGNRTHGAYARAMTRPLEDEHRERLRAEFPGAAATPGGDDLINTASCRLAMLERFVGFVEDAGPLRSAAGRAEVQPAAREARVLLDAHERAISALAALEREQGASSAMTAAQRALLKGRGELVDGDVVDDDQDEDER
jgi:hypothetical protein